MKEIDEKQNDLVSSIADTLSDLSDSAIQFISDNDIADKIPSVGIITNGIRVFKSVHDIIFLNNIKKFIKNVKENNVSAEEINEHFDNLSKDKRNKELYLVISYIEQTKDENKIQFFSKIYSNYINGKISEEQLREYFNIVDNMFITDFPILKDIYLNPNYKEANREEAFRCERIHSLGLTGFSIKGLYPMDEEYERFGVIVISALGKEFCQTIFD